MDPEGSAESSAHEAAGQRRKMCSGNPPPPLDGNKQPFVGSITLSAVGLAPKTNKNPPLRSPVASGQQTQEMRAHSSDRAGTESGAAQGRAAQRAPHHTPGIRPQQSQKHSTTQKNPLAHTGGGLDGNGISGDGAARANLPLVFLLLGHGCAWVLRGKVGGGKKLLLLQEQKKENGATATHEGKQREKKRAK